jgi:hypothetical protein
MNLVVHDSVYQEPIVLDMTFPEPVPLPAQLMIVKAGIEAFSQRQPKHHRFQRRKILSSPFGPLPTSLKGTGKAG